LTLAPLWAKTHLFHKIIYSCPTVLNIFC